VAEVRSSRVSIRRTVWALIVPLPLLVAAILFGIRDRRWNWLVAVAAVSSVTWWVAWKMAWFTDSEMPPLGGAMLFAAWALAPLVFGTALGVYLGRGRDGPPGLRPPQRG
jgi:hypothetical protein